MYLQKRIGPFDVQAENVQAGFITFKQLLFIQMQGCQKNISQEINNNSTPRINYTDFSILRDHRGLKNTKGEKRKEKELLYFLKQSFLYEWHFYF